MKKVLMIFADGFEEIEAIATADVLRRGGVELVIAGLSSTTVTGAHDIIVKADCLLDAVNPSDFNAVVLPGGMPGSINLKNSDLVMLTVQNVYNSGGIAAAICAAPIAMSRAGVLEGKKFTCFPGFEGQCTNAQHTGNRLEKDGNVITAKGAGVSLEFGAKILEALGYDDKAREILSGMFAK